MAISTNSIIHYTSTFDVLKLILKEGFKIKYCLESLKLGATGDGSNAAHPMISFCDIPLSDAERHFDAYGRYGIGLTKKWAMKNGVNPVLYIDKNSLIAKSIYELIKARRDKASNLTDEQKSRILEIKSYAKNYAGELKRGGINKSDYRFYDEREWRLVAPKDKIKASFSVLPSEYLADKDKYNNNISSCRFTFNPNDISYIIVDKTSEIPDMVNFLRNEYRKKCTAEELDVLLSKICSTEQIIADY
ncbi:MAG: hypothetical protein LBN95_07165 [Prevotellaceae bacterium]|jgi:hypothetical protein|nr:hypothetical protein [Prevotellaceae bacterium]